VLCGVVLVEPNENPAFRVDGCCVVELVDVPRPEEGPKRLVCGVVVVDVVVVVVVDGAELPKVNPVLVDVDAGIF